MNKLKFTFLSLALFMGHFLHAQTTNSAPYCSAGYDDESNGPFGAIPVPHYISNVTLGTLNNTSGDTQYASPHYVFYNNIAAPDLKTDSSYTLSIAHDSSVTIHFVAVYIDYNHNNNFDDPGEKVLQQTMIANSVTNPSTATITIPATALTGTTRMRVMVFEDDMYTGSHTDATPCTADSTGSLDWGETEDYNVTITGGNPASVNDITNTTIAAIYPNPATGYAYIDNAFVGSLLTITDIQGRSLRTNKISCNKIDVSSLVPGIYFIRIIKDNKTYTQRLSVD